MKGNRQLELCREAVAEAGGMPTLKRVFEPDEFDDLVRDARDDEMIVVAHLAVLAKKSLKGRGRNATLLLRLGMLERAALVIFDAESVISSDNKAQRAEHLEAVVNKVAYGRTLGSDQAAKMAATRSERRPRGIVDEWLSKSREADRKIVSAHWCDLTIPNAAEAIATFPEQYAELRDLSRKSIERIFGGRTTGAKKRRT